MALMLYGTAQAQLGRFIDKAVQKAVEPKAEQPANKPASTGNTTGKSANSSTTGSSASTVLPITATPVEIIRQCPALPSVKQLVNSINIHASGSEVEAFEAQVVTLRDNAKSILESADQEAQTASDQDADRVAKQFTGYSQTEMDKMSEAEQEAMVSKMLSSMGMGETLDQSGMDAEEIMKTNTELQSINKRWREFALQNEKDEKEAERQIAAIDAKYAPKVFAIKPTKWVSGEDARYDFTDAELKAREDLIVACRTEQFTLWRNHTVKMQERIKTVIDNEVPHYDELMKQHLIATGMTSSAPLTPSAGYNFAIDYLYTAGSVTQLPGIDIFGVLGEKNKK